jgi:hypothetical protein
MKIEKLQIFNYKIWRDGEKLWDLERWIKNYELWLEKLHLWFDFFDDKMSMINISFVDTNKITFFECTLSSPSFATYLLS